MATLDSFHIEINNDEFGCACNLKMKIVNTDHITDISCFGVEEGTDFAFLYDFLKQLFEDEDVECGYSIEQPIGNLGHIVTIALDDKYSVKDELIFRCDEIQVTENENQEVN